MKSTKYLANRGQLSIFFGVTLVLLITVVAFVVNIGIFVKAKINLQNAVDAAAWSGAAVQSRQLTDIAYLNWEMRNTYKEWMFKYYVLGQISNSNTDVEKIFGLNSNGSNLPPPGAKLDFRLRKFQQNEPSGDKWNIPSICIKFTGEPGNMCNIFTTPGLPRTATTGAVGVDETFNEAINQITKVKSQGCVDRSLLNLRAAMLWAYGPGTASLQLFQNAPLIAAQRPGAWTEALELAMRIRNLEAMVNQAPVPEPICRNSEGCLQIENLRQDPNGGAPIHERATKAFWAAYRNLGNSDERGPNEMRESLKITEIPPRISPQPAPQALSNVFIPGTPTPKHYVDLQVYIANLTTFVSTFIPVTRVDNGVPLHGECALAKVGLPVPGYPMGFVKNPNVLTYYAVKGEALFNGLFNPFVGPIALKAYAAAKPFGGRIGPALFQTNSTGFGITARRERTFPYIAALAKNGNTYVLGEPIPSSSNYWVQDDNQNIGGIPDPNTPIRFGIPNLIYDVPDNQSNLGNAQDGGADKVQKVFENNSNVALPPTPAPSTNEQAGLYEARQFWMLKRNLQDTGTAGVVTFDEVDQAIINVRKPTRYEALNYLIPTLPRAGKETADPSAEQENTHPVSFTAQDTDGRQYYQIYAPLFNPDLPYKSMQDVDIQLAEHINRNLIAVDEFSKAIHEVAQFSLQQDATTAQGLYQGAAQSLHNNAVSTQPTCPSLAGNFRFFFTGNGGGPGCQTHLRLVFQEGLQTKINLNPNYLTFFRPTYPRDSDTNYPPNDKLKSAFTPGPLQGASPDGNGVVAHPFLPSVPLMDVHRNFYSTKFVSIKSLMANSDNSYINGDFGAYSEGPPKTPTDLSNSQADQFLNPIEEDFLTELDPEGRGLDH